MAIRRGEGVAPGASAVVQLILDKPIGALHGDRFILRDQSATRTLGGGVVIDPFPSVSRRRSAERSAELLGRDDIASRVRGLYQAGPVPVAAGWPSVRVISTRIAGGL